MNGVVDVRGNNLVTLSRLVERLERGRQELRALADDPEYAPFHLHDTLGEKRDRHIDHPSPRLKLVQRELARRVFSEWRAPFGMFGAIPRRTLLHNARVHAGRSALVTVDIEKCFPSMSNTVVHGAIFRFVGVTEVANLLTRLTTVNFHLPQGAPTSPILANMVLQPAFEELAGRGKRIGVSVSAWIDDFAFSGARADEMIEHAYEVFGRIGLNLARRKIHVFRSRTDALRLTKLVLNRRPSLGRERFEEIRNEIVEAARRGVSEWDLRRLRGVIAFARNVNPAQGERLARLAARVLPNHGHSAPHPPKRFIGIPCDCAFGRDRVVGGATDSRGMTKLGFLVGGVPCQPFSTSEHLESRRKVPPEVPWSEAARWGSSPSTG